MTEPNLTTDELRTLDYFIAQADEFGFSVDWMQVAQAVGEIMQGIPFVPKGAGYDDKLSIKVRQAIIDALKTPGITLEQLRAIRKILRSL